jgi:hypothetical protein
MKLFADMTGKQKVSLVLIAIGLIPYIDVIIRWHMGNIR